MEPEHESKQDAVRRGLEEWFGAHPEFRREPWTSDGLHENNGRYYHHHTRVEPPSGARSFEIDVYLGYASFRIDGASIRVGFREGLLWPEGMAKNKAQSVARVVRFLDDLVQGRVEVRQSTKYRGGRAAFRLGRYDWHRVQAPPPRNFILRWLWRRWG
jgi:hypothetical protein